MVSRTFAEYDRNFEKNLLQAKATSAVDDDDSDNEDHVQTLADRRKYGKNCENIVAQRLIPFQDLQDIVEPWLHLSIGLTNDNLKEMRKECRIIDENDATEELEKKEKVIVMQMERMSELQSVLGEVLKCKYTK